MTYSLINIFSIVGILYSSHIFYRLCSFIWIYFLRSSSVESYLHGRSPYALVTGATDGIGRGIAKELTRRGFNLIIHGRNKEKIEKVAKELKAIRPDRDILTFLADATQPHDFKSMLAPFENLNITIVVNNVGGTEVGARIDERSSDQILDTVRWNALFPLQLTHTLLPQLRRTQGPTLVLNVGSFAGDMPPPRLAIYSACKHFVETLTWALQVDERYYTPSNVQLMYLSVGQVSTNAVQRTPDPICPDSDTFAKAVVHKIGCGRRRIAPHLGHAISHWFMEALGENLGEWTIAQVMKKMYLEDSKMK